MRQQHPTTKTAQIALQGALVTNNDPGTLTSKQPLRRRSWAKLATERTCRKDGYGHHKARPPAIAPPPQTPTYNATRTHTRTHDGEHTPLRDTALARTMPKSSTRRAPLQHGDREKMEDNPLDWRAPPPRSQGKPLMPRVRQALSTRRASVPVGSGQPI